MENKERIIELLTAVRYTTNDIEKIADEMCLLFNVLGRSEQLVCPDCKQPFTKEELEVREHCFNCGWEFAN